MNEDTATAQVLTEVQEMEEQVRRLEAAGLLPGGRKQQPQPLPPWLQKDRVGQNTKTEEERFHRRHENKIRKDVRTKVRRRKGHGRNR